MLVRLLVAGLAGLALSLLCVCVYAHVHWGCEPASDPGSGAGVGDTAMSQNTAALSERGLVWCADNPVIPWMD